MTDTRISGLQSMIIEAAGRGTPPVERWNPPYCGDIGLAIARDGTWSYRGSPIARKQLVKLFASVLRRDDDGRHYLVTPAEKVDVAVEDAPFLAVEMQVDRQPGGDRGPIQTLTFRTNLDDVVVCGADNPLTFQLEDGTGGLKPYVRVRGRLDALLTRSLYLDLVGLAVPESLGDRHMQAMDPDTLGVWSGSVFFPLRPEPRDRD